MNAFRVLVIALICFVPSACASPSGTSNSTKSNQPKPTPLLDGTMSYQSFAQIKALPKLKNAKWKTLEFSSGGMTVETNGYSHLGFTGTATFAFFHDQLLRTWFVTPQYVKYRKTLTKKLRIKWDKTGQAIDGNTEIYFNGQTVAWSDRKLQEDAAFWIGNQSNYNNQHL